MPNNEGLSGDRSYGAMGWTVSGTRLAQEYDPATPYNMRHANSDVLSFVTTTIGHVAGLTMDESRTRIRTFAPFDPFDEEPSIAEAAE